MTRDRFFDALISAQNQGKFYRKKRTQKGEEFRVQDPPSMQEVHRGVWCRRCHARHPYNGTAQTRLGISYEYRGNTRVLLWICPHTGDVVGELWLGMNKHDDGGGEGEE